MPEKDLSPSLRSVDNIATSHCRFADRGYEPVLTISQVTKCHDHTSLPSP